MKKFEFLEHTADIKFKAFGKTISALFENCALAFSNYISRGEKIKRTITKKINIFSEKDKESLLYNFLENLITLLDTDNFIVSKAKIKIKNNNLQAILKGHSAGRYIGLDHVKAVTYAEMYVKQKKDKTWEAQVVLDV